MEVCQKRFFLYKKLIDSAFLAQSKTFRMPKVQFQIYFCQDDAKA